jgi:hypothetical protein
MAGTSDGVNKLRLWNVQIKRSDVEIDSTNEDTFDERDMTAVLDQIPGAWEDARRGLAQALRGETIPLDKL